MVKYIEQTHKMASGSKSAAKKYDPWWEWPFEFDFKGKDGEYYAVHGVMKGGHRMDAIQYDSIERWDDESDDFVPLSLYDARAFKGSLNHRLVFDLISKEVKKKEQREGRRASGRQKESRFQQWGKSASADVMRNWRSKDTPAEQQEVLGQAMAESYEVVQTVLMLAKKTEGVDPQSVNKALRSLGAAMFDL